MEGARSDVGHGEGGWPRLLGASPDGSNPVDAGQAPARCRTHRPVGHPVWRCHGVRRCFTAPSNSGRHGEDAVRCGERSRRPLALDVVARTHARTTQRAPWRPRHHAQRSWTGQLVRSMAHAAARPAVQSHACAWPWLTSPFPGPMPGCFNQQPHPRSAAPSCESPVGEAAWRPGGTTLSLQRRVCVCRLCALPVLVVLVLVLVLLLLLCC